jgi:uncharacterized cupin superfamily protein
MSAPAVAFAAPAEVELAPNPINPAWIIEGNPQARAKRLAESADGTSSVMAWSCTPGRFEWHYAVDETVHIISGEVLVTDENGKIHRLGPGDMAFFPGRQPQRLASDEDRAQARGLPPQHAAALRLRAAGLEQAVSSPDRLPDRQRPRRGPGAKRRRSGSRGGVGLSPLIPTHAGIQP